MAKQRQRQLRIFRNRESVIGMALVLLVLAGAAVGPLLYPSPNEQHLEERLRPPLSRGGDGKLHILGTDPLGRDLLSRILWGAQISLVVGLSSVLIAGAIGIPVGMIAGYRGGWVDTLLMRIVDIQLAFPDILLALAIVAVLGPSLTNVIITIVLTTWVRYARMSRGSTLVVKEQVYVESARAIGIGRIRMLGRYILPNIATPLIILGTIQVGSAIVMESALSFLGLGLPPPAPSWGGLLAEGREYMMNGWWVSTFPGLAILVAVLGVNLLGNGLRVLFDPKLDI